MAPIVGLHPPVCCAKAHPHPSLRLFQTRHRLFVRARRLQQTLRRRSGRLRVARGAAHFRGTVAEP